MRRISRHLPLFGFGLAFLAVHLPWIAHPAAALTLNALDLAEWLSLHPVVRAESPPLLSAWLLRVVCAACAVGMAFSVRRGWLLGLCALLPLLPPLEFLRGAGGDPNYRQQCGIAMGTGVLVLLGGVLPLCAEHIPARAHKLLPRLPLVPSVLGGGAALAGLARAKPLVDAMYHAGLGIGGPLALLGFGLVAVGALAQAPASSSPSPGMSGVASGVGDGSGVGAQTGGSVISTG